MTLESIAGDDWNTTDKQPSKRTFRTPLRLPVAPTRSVVPTEPFTQATDLHAGETAYFSLGYTRIGEAALWVFGVAPFTHKPNTVNLWTRQEIEAGLVPTQVAPFKFTILVTRKNGKPRRFTTKLKFPYSREDGPTPVFSPLVFDELSIAAPTEMGMFAFGWACWFTYMVRYPDKWAARVERHRQLLLAMGVDLPWMHRLEKTPFLWVLIALTVVIILPASSSCCSTRPLCRTSARTTPHEP